MAYSYEQYLGDGSTDVFSIGFEYLLQEHVQVTVDGETVEFEFITPSSVQLSTPPPTNAVVYVRRVTPVADRVVDFQDGSTLEERDLDNQASQLLYIVQEAYDKLTSLLVQTFDGKWDGAGRKLSNLLPGTEPGDAVTYEQTVGLSDAAETARDEAVAAQQGAETARDEAVAAAASVIPMDGSNIVDGSITQEKIDPNVALGGPSLGTDSIIRTNADTIDEDITIPSGTNGMTAGPVTIAAGRTVTVNGNWSIV